MFRSGDDVDDVIIIIIIIRVVVVLFLFAIVIVLIHRLCCGDEGLVDWELRSRRYIRLTLRY